MYRRHRSNPQVNLPWWFYAILSIGAYVLSAHFPLLPAFAPLLKLAAGLFFVIAVLLLLWQLIKSALGLNLLARYASPRSALTRFGLEMGKELFRVGLRKWENGGRSSGAQPGAAEARAVSGKALILGESGAWRAFMEKLAARNIYVVRPEELQPLLQNMRAACKPAIDRFHSEVAACVRYKNARISLLRAEPGIFSALINWFLILKTKYDISRLFALEQRYAALLAGDIAEVEAALQSPELAGALAELEVIEKLKELPGDCIVLNDVRLKARKIRKFNGGAALVSAQLDHLVITPAGVFVLETKRWSRKFAREGVYHDPFDQVQRAGNVCFNLLKAEFGGVMVRNVIVCAGSLPTPPEESFTKVTNIAGLNGYILWFKEKALDPIAIRDIREYLRAGMPPPLAVAHSTELAPAERLNSAFLRETLQHAERAGFGEAAGKSRAVLIPTEPPPLKAREDVKYMPPAMRKELEEKEKDKRQAHLSKKSGETAAPEVGKTQELLSPNAPKDLKYMPPSMRAEFEEK